MFFNGFLSGIDRYRSNPSGLLGDTMALSVADLSEHIITRRRLYALALGADIELLRRVHGESVVAEALRLADEAAQRKQAPQTPNAEHAREIADALGHVMEERRTAHPRNRR
jgi:hypothetical protein